MASPPPPSCRWSCGTRSYSYSRKLSYSIVFSFHETPSKRCRFRILSLHNSPSGVPSSSSNPLGDENPRSRSGADFGSRKQAELSNNSPNSITSKVSAGSIQINRSRKKQTQRSLWRRIFFASKKVRSIILLNVLTLIYGIELGFWVSLGYLMQALGLLTSDAGRASFISTLTVIVVPLLDGMLGATVPAHTWFGALMSIIGVAMLESSGSPPSVGDLLNFLSAVFFGVHMLRTEHISRTTHKKKFLPLLGFEVCVIALFSTIWYFSQGWFGGIQDSSPSSWTWTVFWDWMVTFPWIPALYTGILTTGLCLWIEMSAMRDVSATETAIIYGLEPVWGAGFAWFLLGERWGAIGWIGAALVLGGSLTVQILASSPSQSDVNEGLIERADLLSDKKNGLSTTPVVISSNDNRRNLLK
ncbi:uncharacterized protein LOC119990342 isoform X2 [Tripterygium wilfordii]|uniref:uncharacterized protein LOC119990342 isoform X2 n=1 Tax=Tripterygium wilfordii TaxID=458696 RepID=UPI0018F8503B|nr:uncharacterized protein LOC119990342 isoform X2 [Tripterygium wilfordii]